MESDNSRDILESVVITGTEDAPQYIRLSDNSVISADLLQQHNGLVVDIGGELVPVSYSSEDILSQELTEEDRNLAAALVAVQLQQQQKHQQNQDGSIPLVAGTKLLEDQQLILAQDKAGGQSYLRIVNSDSVYIDQQGLKLVENVRLPATSIATSVVQSVQSIQNVHSVSDGTYELTEETPMHDEHHIVEIPKTEVQEIILDSDHESLRHDNRGRKNLPHKKRISKKLQRISHQQIMKVQKFNCAICEQEFFNEFECAEHETNCGVQETEAEVEAVEPAPVNPSPFSCQLCNTPFEDQLGFFEHLKGHYEQPAIPTPAPLEPKPSPPPPPPATPTPTPKKRSPVKRNSSSTKQTASTPKQTTPPVKKTPASAKQNATKQPPAPVPIRQPSARQASRREKEVVVVKEKKPNIVELPESVPQQQETLLSSLLSLTCIDCNKTFRRQKNFEAHMREFHSKKEIETMDEFSEPEDMMAGIEMPPHEDEEDFDDPRDSKAWYTEMADDDLQQAEEDLKEMEKDEHVCHLCQQPFPLRAILLQHLVTCRIASGNLDPTPAVLVRKKNKKMTPKEKLYCEECDRNFKHRNSLLYHMRSHTGIRPHQCELCGKSFFASSALKVHLRLHSGDKPYDCEHCGRKFRQWGDLKYHITSIHSDTKEYQCEYCGKEFARKYSLVVHRRIHTGERNYKCEYCGKTFRASSYLQNHRKIHTGEKPHSCPICSKPFRVRSDMKRHEKTHGKGITPRAPRRTTQQSATAAAAAAAEAEAAAVAEATASITTQLIKVQKEEIEDNDESNELHIGEEEEVTEHILGVEEYAQPVPIENLAEMGISKRNLYTNGHELFLVTYPNEIQTAGGREVTANWIQQPATS